MSSDICGVCGLGEEDTEEGSLWTACNECEAWYHNNCVGIERKLSASETWTCEECVEQKQLLEEQKRLEQEKKAQSEKLQALERQKITQDKDKKLKAVKLKREERKKQLNELKEKVAREAEALEVLKKETAELETSMNELNADGIDLGGINDEIVHEDPPGGNVNALAEDQGASVVMKLLEQQARLVNRHYLLELPEFDGSPEAWPLFIAQYRSTEREGSFTSVENLNRLRKCLKGRARKSVEGLLTLPDNVVQVMEVLEMSFGGMDMLVKAKLKALRDLPAVNENKPATVKSFYEFIMNIKACLMNANAAAYVASPQLLDSLVDKLPVNLERSWIKQRLKSGNSTLDEFMSWFKPMYQCSVLQDVEASTSKTHRVNTHVDEDGKKAEDVHEKRKTNESSDPKSCPCCKRDSHKLPECGKFKKFKLRGRWDFVRRRKLCFICLLGRHYQKDCSATKPCNVDKCVALHNPLLHKYESHETDLQNQKQEAEVLGHHRDDPSTFYRSLPVELKNDGKSIIVWAFLDDGSGPTLISESVARKLNLDGPESEICLKWSDGERQQRFISKKVSLKISGVNQKDKFVLSEVRTTPVLDLPLPHDITNLKSKYKHLKDVTMPNVPRMKPELLIGLQHVKLMLPHSIREGAWNTPVASMTKLGWAIYGRDSSAPNIESAYSCHMCECFEDKHDLNELIKSFHTTESFGVVVPKNQLKSMSDEIAMKTLRETLKFCDGRYEVGLLWKNPDITLPDNRSMALRRLTCLERKLEKDPLLKKAVQNKFLENVEKGFLRKAKPREIDGFSGRKWFLPMFSVQNPNKPAKIRLVYDAAAKFDGVSLNDALLKGPDNQKSIFGVLIRSRRGAIVIGGDIREFYHQVKMKKDDQYCQLVYWRNMQTNLAPDVYVIEVLLMGSTCSSSSANEAKNVNAARFKSQYPRAYTAITEAHYADDYFDSVDTIEEAIDLGRQVKSIHAQGGFEIRNWISNDINVLQALEPNYTENAAIDLSLDDSQSEEKILGLYWNTVDDCFLFKVSYARVDRDILEKKRVPTKREVVRVVMSPYDPMGMLAPIIVAAKVVVQSLWRSGCDWDDPIPLEILPAWENWLNALQQIVHVRVPRRYSNLLPSSSNVELHLFADSSELAFAAVGYLRVECQDDVSVSFVAAKTRVAPQRALSIPRLELQAAVLATRLSNTICQEISLSINRVIFWTDSQTVLGWLRSTHRRYSSFVSNRVSEILESTELNDWRWVPSKKNVADDATKWENEPTVSKRWFSGAEFLQHAEAMWPVEVKRTNETQEEERTIQYHATHKQISEKYEFINPARFSNWNRLVRAVAFVLRYVKCLNARISRESRQKLSCCRNLKSRIESMDELSAEEINAAKIVLMKKCQVETYSVEIQTLAREKKVLKTSKIYKLVPFLDGNGLLRVDTRLDASPCLVDYDTRKPVILEGSHRITQLTIKSVHLRLHHRSRETVISELRQCYWIPRIRVFVNQVIDQCQQCAVYRAKPQIPRMANLPIERLSPYLPPFTHTGVDFMGPFLVAVGRRREKRWICLFTCMTMRAIHMEVACSLDTSSCVMCLRNFMSRWGRPRVIMSDNGTNLKATEKELKSMIQDVDWNVVQSDSHFSDAVEHPVEWRFIPPAAPHFGGAWERMVRTVKDTLYRVLKSQVPRDETFRSAVIEVEAIVNSRPLNYSSTKSINEPAITPNLLLRKGANEPPNSRDVAKFDSRKQWVIAQQMSQEFWNRWVLEYLPTIANRSKWYDEKKPLKIGQLVLIIDNNLKRCEWRRAIVTDVSTGADGRVRSATVKTAKGSFFRLVSKLAVIKDNIDNVI